MSQMVPPTTPPLVALAEEDDRRRLRLRMHQVLWTMITVFLTAWVCTFGVIPAIIAVMIAKHVLVAILLMGLGVDAPQGTASH